jgi:hypothetical protein
MAEGRGKPEPTLEMRIAAIEDKLAHLGVSEDDLRTYFKVASQLAGRMGAGEPPGPYACGSCTHPVPCSPFVMPVPCYCIPVLPHVTPGINDCIPFFSSAMSAGGVGAQFGTLGKQQEEK